MSENFFGFFFLIGLEYNIHNKVRIDKNNPINVIDIAKALF